jgi:hypothetical protein
VCLGWHVDHGIRLPAAHHGFDLAGHNFRIRGNPRPVKGRLHQTTLASVVAARAHRQTVAEKSTGLGEQPPTPVESTVVEQNLVDEIRVAHDIAAPRTNANAGEVRVRRQ